MVAFLARVRRRLRVLWLAATVVWIAPVLGALALALVLVGRIRPWAWPEPAAVVLAGLAVLALVVAASVVRISDHVAARAADRGLDSRDALVTALEVDGSSGTFGPRVHRRAEEVVATADVVRALPVRVRARRLAAGGAMGALALVAGIVANPQDDVRRQQEFEAALADEAVQAIEEAASSLEAEAVEPEDVAPTVEELEALAEELAESSTLEEAEARLDEAEAALAAGLTPEALAREAAVTGLDRSLESEPLPGAGAADDAAAQLEAAAQEVAGLDDDEAVALAERLERLAETQAAGNPAVSAPLGRAADALASGDRAAAAESLSEASAAQQSAAAETRADDARRSALGAIADARRRLASGRSGEQAHGRGEGQGEGQAQGEGQGKGDGKGEGQGDGKGEGQGEGQGQGKGSGEPSGPVAGATGGNGEGRGGQGSAQGQPGTDPVGEEARTDEPSLFDPTGGRGDEISLGGSPTGDDPGDVVGRGDGTSGRGSSFVPLSRAIDSFRQRVTSALDDPALSPSMRELVRAYFGRLTEGTSR